MRFVITWAVLGLSLFVSGCVLTGFGGRIAANELAECEDFDPVLFETDLFFLKGWLKVREPSDVLTVFIEGDGRAWINRRTPSLDPTPKVPTGFHLAVADQAPAILYLARPCQYVEDEERKNCGLQWWTSGRFAPEVVQSMNEAIDQALQITGATKVALVGFSGGGAVALLCAATRTDTVVVYTIAGNLDHKAWTDFHKISPLRGSLNPVNYTEVLKSIPQLHIVGEEDDAVPKETVERYLNSVGADCERNKICVETVKGAGHNYEWQSVWSKMRKSYSFR